MSNIDKKHTSITGGWKSTLNKIRSSKRGRLAIGILIFYIFLAIFGDFIANDKPFYAKRDGQHEFPILKNYFVQMGWAKFDGVVFREGWKNLKYEKVLWPPIPYLSTNLDLKNDQFVSPFGPQDVASWKQWHWMGTDQLGRDVAAGIITGARSALLVGLIAMGIAAFIGILLGAIAGFFGDDRLKFSAIGFFLRLSAISLGIFWAFNATSFFNLQSSNFFVKAIIGLLIIVTMFLLTNQLSNWLDNKYRLKRNFSLPVDLIVMRIIEIINSIPGLLLIVALVAIVSEPTIYSVMIIIGCIAWTGIARFMRGELIKVRNLPYIEATEAMGFGAFRILMKHAIPNALGPVAIAIAFGMAGAILTEATLSFIGIGGAADQVTWGSLINEARKNISAWWIAIIPGLMIFLVISCFNILGESFSGLLGQQMD